jgi:dipeptidyl aminopeptidase/acylaminoacyl peptidase
MKVSFQCSCGAPYEVDSALAGKKARCKVCAKEFRIPPAPRPEVDHVGHLYDLADGPAAPLPRRTEPRVVPDADLTARPGRPRSKKQASVSSRFGLTSSEATRIAGVGVFVIALVAIAVGVSGRRSGARSSGWPATLSEARRGFQTSLVPRRSDREPVDPPPPQVFRLVRYPSPAGNLPAYLTPDPGDGLKHPAIVWITGGDCNSIGDVWSPARASNDQTAAAFRQAGVIMMFPSLRGGNDNPGVKEGFLGEVNDVLASAEFLARQSYVDPSRLYLGGHSTGGTLVLLTAATSDRFRAVFSFGPVHDVSGYGSEFLPFNTWNRREVEIRSPIYWLDSVQSPTFVFEGSSRGNLASLRAMQSASKNPRLRFHVVNGADHFSILAPTTRTLAAKVLKDQGPSTSITLSQGALDGPFGR